MRSHYAAVKRLTQSIDKIDALLASIEADEYTLFKGVKLPTAEIKTVLIGEKKRLEERRQFHGEKSGKLESVNFTPSEKWGDYLKTVKNWQADS